MSNATNAEMEEFWMAFLHKALWVFFAHVLFHTVPFVLLNNFTTWYNLLKDTTITYLLDEYVFLAAK